MIDEALVAQLNAGYLCPPDAGPAWRAAHAEGIDMALVEDTLRLTPAERLRMHQGALKLVLAVKRARQRHGTEL
jgi:hypothetical protein